MSTYGQVQQSRGVERTRLESGHEVHVYPNVIEVWLDGEKLLAVTPEDWGRMVDFIGISGVRS